MTATNNRPTPAGDLGLPRNLWVNRCTLELITLYKVLLSSLLGSMSLPEAIEWSERLWEDAGATAPEEAARCAVADLVHLSSADDPPGGPCSLN